MKTDEIAHGGGGCASCSDSEHHRSVGAGTSTSPVHWSCPLAVAIRFVDVRALHIDIRASAVVILGLPIRSYLVQLQNSNIQGIPIK